ncbi:hypothetical protein R3W88_022225 [Solanum pinnatisectum]|uniref:Terpene synthase N-terminal domain-containing protein n=1 Tax=Solanum pinnatisectum TaxID=50273 RepID=A0AAV9LXX6_9SOLN|nr:hypothetical protein R3W88_022225 [Solanum pinnatisectum]
MNNLREEIKNMLSSIGDGRSSVSPYDTAWASFIIDHTDINGTSKRPLFLSCLKWIIDNQLDDGSWGEELVFCIYDRLLNTLACVVALTLWNTCLHKRNKGVMFIKENLRKLEGGEVVNMTSGFEFVFPSLLEKAQQLHIDNIPYDASVIKDIYARREVKFTRFPKDLIHTIPTIVLFSLEGLKDLDWQRLLKLQMEDGSFLTSPSSTAIAFMETNDDKCLTFLQNVVQKFNGGVPCSYPADIQARLWGIDRLQRLGISYYFEEEIKDLLEYVFRNWDKENGFFSARNSNICDVDTTCMAIRLLRLHGFDVNVLNKFKDGDEFFCLRGESNKSATVMFNLYRCSQALFQGEMILEEAKNFTYNFLHQYLANNQSKDKWVIAKDIPWESDFDNYKILPSQVSGRKWFEKCNFQQFGINKKEVLVSYFLAASSIFEVEKSRQRLAWAKSCILCKMITFYINQEATTWNSLLMEFNSYSDMSRKKSNETKEIMVLNNLYQFLHQLGKETYQDLGIDIHHQLHNVWEEWLMSLNNTPCQEEAELLVHTINLAAGHMTHDEILSKHTNKVCHMLNEFQNGQISNSSKARDIEFYMQALVKLVFSNTSSNNINQDIKQTFFAVVKTFYYTAHVSEDTINHHISKLKFFFRKPSNILM